MLTHVANYTKTPRFHSSTAISFIHAQPVILRLTTRLAVFQPKLLYAIAYASRASGAFPQRLGGAVTREHTLARRPLATSLCEATFGRVITSGSAYAECSLRSKASTVHFVTLPSRRSRGDRPTIAAVTERPPYHRGGHGVAALPFRGFGRIKCRIAVSSF